MILSLFAQAVDRQTASVHPFPLPILKNSTHTPCAPSALTYH